MKEAISIESNNALFSVAKRCDTELKAAIKANPKIHFDKISTPILKKHYQDIAAICGYVDFIHAIGVLNGRYNDYR